MSQKPSRVPVPQRIASKLRQVTRFGREISAVTGALGTKGGLIYVAHVFEQFHNILATGMLRPADEKMKGKVWTFHIGQTPIALDGRLFSGGREMYCRQVYFSEPGFDIRANDIVVDLGANCGLLSVLAAKKGARVLAVEAQAEYKARIDELARANSCRDLIEIESVLVGSGGVFGERGLFEAESQSDGRAPLQARMSDLLQKHNISQIDFLKIDIEGSEYALLMNDCGWLEGVRRISMEIHTQFGDHIELAEHLRSLGFQVVLKSNDQRRVTRVEEPSGYLYAWRPG